MKITHIINALETGGAERLLTEMLPLMQAAGHEVNIVLLKSTNDVFEQKLKQLGIRVEAVNICAGRYNPLNAFKLAKYIKNSDIVHTHLFPSQYWGALAVKLWRKRIKLFTTEHSTFNSRGKYAITSWLDKHIYALYDGIICISKGTADFVKQRVPQNVAIRVIENGVRLPSASTSVPAEQRDKFIPGLSADDFVIMQVARFSEQKNQDCVIRALSKLPHNVHAVFVGYGVREALCKDLAQRMGVADRTHFLGERSDIDDLWRIADIGVMSSHWEGFGLAAVEGIPNADGRVELQALCYGKDDDGRGHLGGEKSHSHVDVRNVQLYGRGEEIPRGVSQLTAQIHQQQAQDQHDDAEYEIHRGADKTAPDNAVYAHGQGVGEIALGRVDGAVPALYHHDQGREAQAEACRAKHKEYSAAEEADNAAAGVEQAERKI